jgi:glycosyltransferase involved in cell wall biosynthesis
MLFASLLYPGVECHARSRNQMRDTTFLIAKKILVITIGYPHPSRGASSVIFYWYLNALRKSGLRVEHLLIVSTDEVSAKSEQEYLEAISPDADFAVSIFSMLNAREVRRSYLNLQAYELPDDVLLHVKSFQPDAVVCFDIMAAVMAQSMRLDRLLIWLGDLSFQTNFYHAYYDFKVEPRKFLGLIRSYLIGILWKRCYRKILCGQQHVITSSYSSVARLARLGISSRYWPYPWPGESATEAAIVSKPAKPTFILFGTLAALGSRSAFEFLLKSVYPLLLRTWGSGGFTILISGMREIPEWVRADLDLRPEFRFLGFVDNLAAEVRRCHAVLAPISVPVGNRSRIVTAMSLGALVIAHVNTAKGNPELISGKNCLLASSAREFAEHMQLAFINPDLEVRLGASVRETYSRSFEPAAASNRLLKELNSILL